MAPLIPIAIGAGVLLLAVIGKKKTGQALDNNVSVDPAPAPAPVHIPQQNRVTGGVGDTSSPANRMTGGSTYTPPNTAAPMTRGKPPSQVPATLPPVPTIKAPVTVGNAFLASAMAKIGKSSSGMK